LKLSNSTQ
jgi:alpha,alpha-trehalase